MRAWYRFIDTLGHFWAWVEARFHALGRRHKRQKVEAAKETEKLEDSARHVGQEAILNPWDRVDDQPFFPTFLKIVPVHNQFYGHGAFMGAAPALLADPKWLRILAFLMPDVYEQVDAVVKGGGGASAVIPLFENNPVMCAYGVWRNFESRIWLGQDGAHDLSGMEWAVFIDDDQVEAWTDAPPDARGEILPRIVDTMVIAHASTTDTVQEAIGICQYQDIRKATKTDMGGVEVGAWLDLYGRALLLARAPELADAIRQTEGEPRVDTDEACQRHTFVHRLAPAEVVEVHGAVTGRERLSVVLEIKSLRSSPELLSAMVRELNTRGIHVVAVCSFQLDEVAGVSETRQVVAGTELLGPREVLFFHYSGDLQEACDEGRVPRGQSVLFNGASLLEENQPDPETAPVYAVKDDVVTELEAYRQRLDLHIGLYVQEGDCDNAAAELLSDLLHNAETTFELGFAWGGLQDEVAITADLTARLGYGSQKALGLVGRAKHWQVGKAAPHTSTPWDDD